MLFSIRIEDMTCHTTPWIKGCIHMCVRIRARVHARVRILNRFSCVLVMCIHSAISLVIESERERTGADEDAHVDTLLNT